jgi:trehalose 6-phosphate synthase
MRLSLRFIVPLALVLGLIAYVVTPLVDRLALRWFVRDLDLRASLIANTIDEPVRALLDSGNTRGIQQYFVRITRDERVYAIGLCPSATARPISSVGFPSDIQCDSLERFQGDSAHVITPATGPLLVSVRTLQTASGVGRQLILVHDMSFVTRRSEETRRYLFYFFIGLAALVSTITVFIAQLSWRGWVTSLRTLLRGERLRAEGLESHSGDLQPIANDLRELIRDLQADHRLRDDERIAWSADSLRDILHRELRGHEVIIVSNREPYIHVKHNDGIAIQRPASGLVTAVEPIMRACSGTWIAHGSGSGDREVVDKHSRVAVPPDSPAYQLRRVWLTPEQEAGYYYGFANEGLWPLCHIAHVRPTFRASDWEQYEEVNRLFADAILEEVRVRDPVVLIQDYHLALLPRMVRDRLPDATIVTFWHIPWPNPEAFGICPWREQVIKGMLGSSILGFHTQFHCNNFLDTVDRTVEARVDRETFTVSYEGKGTAVKRYPISVEWPPSAELTARPVTQCRAAIRDLHGLPENHSIGVGVDRLDYTKGIEERFRAVERLMEMHTEWIGRFTFVQIAAPTRTSIDDYHLYEERVRRLAARINARFPNVAHPPIKLLVEHHDTADVAVYYRGADVCFVSSLHDGMNLVAKEFVAARDDDAGVLVLSRFTGAARELPEALIVNPYDVEQSASALHVALTMPKSLQRERMKLMRALIAEFNVFRWAGRMLIDAAAIRRRGALAGRSRGIWMPGQTPSEGEVAVAVTR